MEKAFELWERFHADATWEPFDKIDDYTTECNITLSIDGYEFVGWGDVCCGEKEIGELECITPEGETIKIY